MEPEKLQKTAQDVITEVETKLKGGNGRQTQQDGQIFVAMLLDAVKNLLERVDKLEQKSGIINL